LDDIGGFGGRGDQDEDDEGKTATAPATEAEAATDLGAQPDSAPAPEGTEAHYYRTSNGTEVDLVLTLPDGKIWAIDVKRSSAPKAERGFHSACADLDPSKRFLVYPGAERFPLDEFTDAIGVGALAKELQSIQ
jgi:predicted AAA+ superfamily ATPase